MQIQRLRITDKNNLPFDTQIQPQKGSSGSLNGCGLCLVLALSAVSFCIQTIRSTLLTLALTYHRC
ncbi:hypothetical protein AALO_G00167500 [Alosa alosa]|uniref:Uncharacterized protein n=1 Tax=Alosa alosa TaxID=278164 RepID=A0AAV6GBV6_9TELE|nr:hypothetical protein AALO_G00167500 [Alosa alosa]